MNKRNEQKTLILSDALRVNLNAKFELNPKFGSRKSKHLKCGKKHSFYVLISMLSKLTRKTLRLRQLTLLVGKDPKIATLFH